MLARDQTYNVQAKSVCLDKGLVCSVNVQLLTVIILSDTSFLRIILNAVSLSHAVIGFQWQLEHGLIT